MADTFFNPISIPDVPESTVIPAAEPGYLKLYSKNGKLKQVNNAGEELTLTNDGTGGVVTQLQVDAGNASTTFQQYQLRLDFGSGGANINPTGTV